MAPRSAAAAAAAWTLVRNVHFGPSAQTCTVGDPGVGPRNLRYNKPCGELLTSAQIWAPLLESWWQCFSALVHNRIICFAFKNSDAWGPHPLWLYQIIWELGLSDQCFYISWGDSTCWVPGPSRSLLFAVWVRAVCWSLVIPVLHTVRDMSFSWSVVWAALGIWAAVYTMHLLHLWLVMWHLLFLSQDTTDYVAYVAKDPVNRRGKLCVTFVISHSHAVGLNIGYKLVFMISALFTCTNKCSLVLSVIIELYGQWSVTAHLAGLGETGYLRVWTTHLYRRHWISESLKHTPVSRRLALGTPDLCKAAPT